MARIKDREIAIKLRKQGNSYSQIKKTLKVSKSTLSYWLRDYPLSEKRMRELRDNSEQRIESYRKTMKKKREDRLKKTYEEQRKKILPLSKREFFIAGLLLYWGEGSKTIKASLELANTDPGVIKLYLKWLYNILLVPKNKISIYLHLYSDMNINKEINYWSKILKIPKSQFSKPYVKKNDSRRINHKGTFGHGTCVVRLNNVKIAEKVFMGIKAISDHYTRYF
ncbi:helix-turn-helix domain-containing protein [Patescibacteria group bacterium]|nr:helix-turn-helix domain-containing protein [Patescibacteria group bacterium]MBU3922851.1 helix-turn-helix domain-containing protein [Patescibacteria group bacterium]